ncbi:MAG: hypothetical protein JWQ66_157 [Mucilaginibacter sp.]|nr:hypothetical protein [Mucilaginibacter sp.]
MDIDLLDFESIQKYLDGEMTPGEEKLFLEKVKKTPVLAEYLDFENDLHSYLHSKESDKYSKQLNYIKADFNIPHDAKDKKLLEAISQNKLKAGGGKVINLFKNKRFYYLAAASISGILVTIGVINYFKSQPKNTPAYTENKKTRPADTVKGKRYQGANYASLADTFYKKDSAAPSKNQLSSQELKDFNKGDYNSIQKIDPNKVYNTGNKNDDKQAKELSYYYKGLSYIETNDPGRAIKNLQRVVDSTKDQQLRIKADWYLALMYLKTNDAAKSAPLLDSVKNNNVEFLLKEKAILLLNKMKK